MLFDEKMGECKEVQSSRSKCAYFCICLELVLNAVSFEYFQRCILHAQHKKMSYA